MTLGEVVMLKRIMVGDELRYVIDSDAYISHVGTPHEGSVPHSGRYAYGSGDTPFQHGARDLYERIRELEKDGMDQKDIAKALGYKSTDELRKVKSNARAEHRLAEEDRVRKLREHGYSTYKISDMTGIPETTVRNLLNADISARTKLTSQKAEEIKTIVDDKKFVDIGAGAELYMGISRTRFDNAVDILVREQGYKRQTIKFDQMGTTHKTTMLVLTPPDVEYEELVANKYNITPLNQYTIHADGTRSFKIEPPVNISSKRVGVVYAEDGGKERDGNMLLRPGVDDISLGRAQYAQVRIGVDGTHYLKGTCRYAYGDELKNMPDGVDILFYTNKHKGTPMCGVDKKTVLKKQSDDEQNPFGASIKQADELKYVQKTYIGKDGKEHQSALNIVYEEGDWSKWSKNIPSQMGSKQAPKLIKRQLDMDYYDRKSEFDDICKLTNPTVKRVLLEKFADNCDSAAVDLKAAPFKGQKTHLILPFPDIKDNEIYAPNYKDGQKVCLVRFPHQGTFEIPELTVRNKGNSAAKAIPNAIDAVGINIRVADILSGADFDGDTVLVIPVGNNGVKIKTDKPLRGLKGFDPQEAYPERDGMTYMTPHNKQIEMGKISNLITDMTLRAAPADHIARATKHAMVVIDAEKHSLDYKRSEKENGIAELKKIYQDDGKGHQGAGTLISRSKSEEHVNERKDFFYSKSTIDPNTGEKIFRETGKTLTRGTIKIFNPGLEKYESKRVVIYNDRKSGRYFYMDSSNPSKPKRVYKDISEFRNVRDEVVKQKSTKMAEARDAYTLTSGGSKDNPGTEIEGVYANYANQMKSLGNRARLEYINTPLLKRDPGAAKEYQTEVESLKDKVNQAKMNAPLERYAQRLANQRVDIYKESESDMSKDKLKKVKGRAIVNARLEVGAKKKSVEITEKEWEAIQKGAVSDATLLTILNNTDLDTIKGYATPRVSKKVLSSSKEQLARTMAASGYTQKEIAERLGVSTSTISNVLKG